MSHFIEGLGSFTVSDLETARAFYSGTLGLDVSSALPDAKGPLWLSVAGERRALIYPKADHQPADFTVFNLAVADIEAAVDELAARGVEFQRYPGYPQDDRGILHGAGHDIAWFNDPAGNNLSLVQFSDAA